jgi:hypothetical protein
MKRFAAVAALSAVLLATGPAAAKNPPLLATVWKGSVVSLTRVDPMTLRPAGGPSLPIGGGAYLVARSPRGVTLAFDTDRGAVLSFVDERTLRLRGSIKLGDGWIGAAAWPSARRLVTVVGSESIVRVVVLDPAARRKLSDHSLPYRDLLASAASRDRVVFLLGETSTIAPVRLTVAGVDGVVRTVLLSQILGGNESPADGSTGVAKLAQPGLAVDPAGGRAAVVDGRGLVAEVDLNTLAVTYHPRAARLPARVGKAFEGWQRSVLWLPSGTLAVTGMDYRATVKEGAGCTPACEEMSGTPAGITLVDTRDWSSSVVGEGASFIARAGNALVAFGGAYVSGLSTPAGIGLRGYGADGTLRFQLFGTEQIGDVQWAGGLVYVAGCNDRCFRIVDPALGKLVGKTETVQTTQLVGL